jgi:hypothetical protein
MKRQSLYIIAATAVMIVSVIACGGSVGNVTSLSSDTSVPQPTDTPGTSATSTPSGPTASDFILATDKAGTNQTTDFSTSDTVYIIFNVDGGKSDTKVTAKWYVLDVSGVDPNTPALTYTGTIADAFGTSPVPASGPVSMIEHLSPKQGGTLPVGHWKVQIFLDDMQVGELPFTISNK